MLGLFQRMRAEKARARAFEAYAQLAETRSFNAAAVDRLVADWRYDCGFTNNEILAALPTMRSRSRDMAKNSPLYARFINLLRENVVGDGFRFKALPFADPASPQTLDAKAAEFLEYHWWRWAKNPYTVDTAHRLNLTQFLALAVECWARDGEAFILLDDSAANRYGLSLRLFRAEYIDHAISFRKDPMTIVRGGVEYAAETNAPIAYYFNGDRTDDPNAVKVQGKVKIRIPARYVIHLYERHDADQTRGIPLGYSALLPLKMLDEYTKAELVAARDEACTIGAFSCPPGQDGAAQMTPEAANDFRNKIAAGQKLFLPDGWSYSSTTPQHPNRGWSDFSIGLQRLVSVGLGVDFAELTGNGSDTISAVARQSILRTREMYKDRQRTVAALVLDRIYFAWLHSALRLRTFAAAGFGEDDFERLSDHEFQGRRWGWIDPSTEVNAAVVATAHGWRTDAEVAAEYGNDIDDCIVEAARIKDAKDAAGLITVGQGLNVATQTQANGSDEGKADGGDENGEVKEDLKPKAKTAKAAKAKWRAKK